MVVVPSWKATLPCGVPLAEVTVAVNVTDSPETVASSLVEIAVELAIAVTV